MSETSVRPDPVMTEIGRGMELGQRGERDAAREVFAGVWDRLGADGDPFHICALAHSMADVQDDPREELVWDLRALEAADLVSDERARLAGWRARWPRSIRRSISTWEMCTGASASGTWHGRIWSVGSTRWGRWATTDTGS